MFQAHSSLQWLAEASERSMNDTAGARDHEEVLKVASGHVLSFQRDALQHRTRRLSDCHCCPHQPVSCPHNHQHQLIYFSVNTQPHSLTSNMTGRHRRPKQKLWAGYRAVSLQRTSYLYVVRPILFFIIQRSITRFLCACACYARIRRAGIILTPTLPLFQILFLSCAPLLS